MANWLPENSVITTLGNKLLSYVVAGLATLDCTRVVVRDTVSTASDNKEYTLSDITSASIKQTGRLLHFQGGIENPSTHDYDTSLITARFSNEELSSNATFYIRQIILFAKLKDIDTAAMASYDPNFVDPGEVPYLVAQSEGQSDYDLMPKRTDNPTSFDYNLYIIHTGTSAVTVSINTTGFVSTATFDLTVQNIMTSIQNIADNQIGRSAGGRTSKVWIPQYDADTRDWSRTDSSFPDQTSYPSSEYFNAYGTHTIVSGGTEYYDQIITGAFSHAEGNQNVVLSRCSHVEGEHNYCGGDPSSSTLAPGPECSFVGGKENTAHTGSSIFVHGIGNLASGAASLTTGTKNVSRSAYSVVCGSMNNTVGAECSILSGTRNTVTGGSNNAVFGSDNSISMGHVKGNETLNIRYSIITGKSNVCDSSSSASIQGENNSSTGCPYSILAGHDNVLYEGSGSAMFGAYNEDSDSENCLISGARNHTYSCESSLVLGGDRLYSDSGNVLTSSSCSIVYGKSNQVISSSWSIVGGISNSVSQTTHSAVFGSQCSVNTCEHSLVSGLSHTFNYIERSVVSGMSNTVYHATDSSVSGSMNIVDNVEQSVVSGAQNTANVSVECSSISGRNNTLSKEVFSSSQHSVVSGLTNRVIDSRSSIVGGSYITAQYVSNSIVSGNGNSVICAMYEGSKARSRGVESSILSGSNNTVAQTESSIISGSSNNVKDYQPHGIPSEVSQTKDIIVSGTLNTITGAYASIISGSSNSVSNIHDSLIIGYDNEISGLNTNINLTNCVLVSGRDNDVTNGTSPQTVFGTSNAVTGGNSLTSGINLISSSDNSATFGKWNAEDTDNLYALVVGGGTNDTDRANIFTVDWSGIIRSNDIYVGESSSSVDSRLSQLESQLEGLEAILIELRGANSGGNSENSTESGSENSSEGNA